jgi:hypothetical protein
MLFSGYDYVPHFATVCPCTMCAAWPPELLQMPQAAVVWAQPRTPGAPSLMPTTTLPGYMLSGGVSVTGALTHMQSGVGDAQDVVRSSPLDFMTRTPTGPPSNAGHKGALLRPQHDNLFLLRPTGPSVSCGNGTGAPSTPGFPATLDVSVAAPGGGADVEEGCSPRILTAQAGGGSAAQVSSTGTGSGPELRGMPPSFSTLPELQANPRSMQPASHLEEPGGFPGLAPGPGGRWE